MYLFNYFQFSSVVHIFSLLRLPAKAFTILGGSHGQNNRERFTPTHPQGCVQNCWGSVDPPQRMCALHCVCIYTAGGGSGPTPKDVHTLLGVSGPTRQRMCTDSWRSARPVHVRGGHRSPVLHPPNRFPRATRLPLLGDRNVSTEFLHCPALGARRVLT